MKILRLTLAVLCGLLITGCSTIKDSDVTEDLDTTTIGTSAVTTTLDSNDTTTSTDTETSVEETSTEATEETSADTEDTSISESETVEESSESVDDSEGSEEDVPTENLSMPIPTACDSQYITDEMCQAISEYFNSMVAIDVDTFKNKQLSAYNLYMEEYLSENESSIEDMLNIYYNNYLLSVADETLEYNAVTFDNITLEYPNDVDSILNTMEYITQLDDVTEQYEDYTISDELTAYYQLNYAIDYTLTADGLDDFTSTKSGSILVLDLDGEISLIMLY